MGRREFITLLGGATAMWQLTAREQQPPTMQVMEFSTARHLRSSAPHSYSDQVGTGSSRAGRFAVKVEDINEGMAARSKGR